MRSLAAYISNIGDHIVREFSLYSETPLLSVGPNCLGRNSCDVERKGRSCGWSGIRRIRRCASGVGGIECSALADIADAWITDRKRLRHAENQRRTSLQRTGIGFVASAVLEEYAVAAANRRFAVAH